LASFDTLIQLDAPPEGSNSLTITSPVSNGCSVDDIGGVDSTEFPANIPFNGFLGVAVNQNRVLAARILKSTYHKGKLPAHGAKYGLVRFLTAGGTPKTKACAINDGVNERWFCRMCGKLSN
jgi:hypothetical protein